MSRIPTRPRNRPPARILPLLGLLFLAGPASPAAASYDPAVYENAKALAGSGDLIGAAVLWQEMLQTAPAAFTLVLEESCDPAAVRSQYDSLEGYHPRFLLSTPERPDCYRLCFGVFPDEGLAERRRGFLPRAHRRATIQPVKTLVPALTAAPAPAERTAQEASAAEWVAAGSAHLEKGEVTEAIRAFRAALERSPTNVGVLNNLGAAYILAQEYASALEALQQAVALAPDYLRAHVNLGGAYYGLGRRRDAIRAMERALDLDRDNVDALYYLAAFYWEADRKSEARAKLSRLRRLDPYHPRVQELTERFGGK